MHPVLIFRHLPHEGPGHLGSFLDRHDIPWRLVRIDAGEPVPASPEKCSGLVFMGGSMSVNDPLPWIADEQDLIRAAVEARVPVLGHCLGGQLMARALGATVGPNPVREIGWHRTWSLDNPVARAWLGEEAGTRDYFHWHGETFGLPDAAVPILSSAHCVNQGYVYQDRHLGLQCHVEMTAGMVREWAAEDPDLVDSESVQSGVTMLQDIENRITTLNRIADRLYTRWITGLSGRQSGP